MKNRILKIMVSSMMLSLVTPISERYDNELGKKRIVLQEESIVELLEETKIESINDEINLAIEEVNKRINEISSIENKMEWFITYKSIIDEYSYMLDPPETIYDYYTSVDLDMLFRVVQAEVGDEYLFEQKVNVVSVIFNRMKHENFPDEIIGILSADQFQSISDGRYKEVEVSDETILACEYGFMFGDTTNGCLFFDSNRKLKYEFVYFDGAHNFYK